MKDKIIREFILEVLDREWDFELDYQMNNKRFKYNVETKTLENIIEASKYVSGRSKTLLASVNTYENELKELKR